MTGEIDESDAKRDEVFRERQTNVADFKFTEKVASVFDDMLDRSVPFYQEIQRMICEMCADFASFPSADSFHSPTVPGAVPSAGLGGATTHPILLADFTGDGKDDLLIGKTVGSPSNRAYLFYGRTNWAPQDVFLADFS